MTDRRSPEPSGRLEQLIEDLSNLCDERLRRVVPAKALDHLGAARHELLLAVTTTIRHHAGNRAPGARRAPASGRGTSRAKGGTVSTGAAATHTRRPRRVKLD
jgi:hypothetical protein